MGWLKTIGTIAGGVLGGPVGGIAGGLIGGAISGGGGRSGGGGVVSKIKDLQQQVLAQGKMAQSLGISDEAIGDITDNLTRNANTTLAQTMNRNRDIVARGNLSPQAEAALNRGAAIGTQQTITGQTAQFGLQQEISRNEAIRFLLGLQLQKQQLKQQRDASLLSGIGQIAGAVPQLLGGGGSN